MYACKGSFRQRILPRYCSLILPETVIHLWIHSIRKWAKMVMPHFRAQQRSSVNFISNIRHTRMHCSVLYGRLLVFFNSSRVKHHPSFRRSLSHSDSVDKLSVLYGMITWTIFDQSLSKTPMVLVENSPGLTSGNSQTQISVQNSAYRFWHTLLR